jgi:nucleotide-binding universal stress UspA family protein
MRKLLVAVDETKGSQAIMSVLKNQVRAPEEVVLVHVQRIFGQSLMGDMLGEAEMGTLRESLVGTEHQEALDANSAKIMAYYRQELANIGLLSIKPVIRSGNPAEEILKVAQEEQVDLMILGCNGKGMLGKMISGSVTRQVEKQVGVPVLVAKPEGAGSWKTKECQTTPSRAQEAYAMEGNK